MYTTEENANLFYKLLPRIKKTDSDVQITYRGVKFTLPFELTRTQIQGKSYKQYK
ncbi:hypothetical protein kac65v162_gp046 [Nodularia phage vB_NspS-kac65v162]|jgi:DNA polymerase elongation subunit (family B)|uniref:Uncharacterized protein n=6 Tax=Ravarandavirus TaxID=2843444 RepID=A0A482MJT9_9CAUD|nr:hypothetical protein HWA92_gp045 [Nodularia phage vB_NpeS-2AV2]YP_009844649.1 hypothetical protein HWC12_gp046 [Nodularia phage vB_NspS-kac65v151]YP_009844860.1 hypothetical protein HWC13_gp051 [Nodularia phage vB_NspS-kac68v161]QBQ73284.1 hypothetical protein kac65v161_gp046 [Nodularia phage vB_NspS-kac65v161]QBQ73490.1 hypothetical protein kac65v162_gp046 [Nodularia phage vB_NspS-kac65v162]QBQ73899.1 hypothetical protein kac68v162_gp051 [Nodularia phage vB_NspS-kac68v162]ALY07497.1 hypot